MILFLWAHPEDLGRAGEAARADGDASASVRLYRTRKAAPVEVRARLVKVQVRVDGPAAR